MFRVLHGEDLRRLISHDQSRPEFTSAAATSSRSDVRDRATIFMNSRVMALPPFRLGCLDRTGDPPPSFVTTSDTFATPHLLLPHPFYVSDRAKDAPAPLPRRKKGNPPENVYGRRRRCLGKTTMVVPSRSGPFKERRLDYERATPHRRCRS